jgi:hypothetical protein
MEGERCPPGGLRRLALAETGQRNERKRSRETQKERKKEKKRKMKCDEKEKQALQ